MVRENLNIALISEMTGISINELEELEIIKKCNYSFSDASITVHFKYYKWGDMLAIYDSYFNLPFSLINDKVKGMDRRTFQDYFYEVEDPMEIALFFNDEIKQKFIDFIKQLRKENFIVMVWKEHKKLTKR